MTIYNKPSDLPAWAEAGDKIQPTDPEIQTGWPLSTVPPSRQRFNWILNWLATGLRYFMQRGIPEWDDTEDYPQYARTQHSGLTWVALVASVGIEPGTDPETWERWGFSASEISSGTDAFLSKSVAGGVNVTLTALEALNSIFEFTGIITANINVIVPAEAKRFIVRNNTTGAFTLIVKTSGGSGVAVLQGSSAELYCDGTNVDFAPKSGATTAQFDNDGSLATTEFVQRALGSFSGVASYAAGATLTAADVGKAILASGGTFTLTLPAASAVPAGGCIQVFCNSGTVTVQRAGADVISGANSATAIVLGVGDTIMLRSNGVAGWLAVEGSSRLGSAAAFGSSLATSGYQKLPSGLIIQWVTGAQQSVGPSTAISLAITLPITFPNGILKAFAISEYVSGNHLYPEISAKSASSVTAIQTNPSGAGTGIGSPSVFAIGY